METQFNPQQERTVERNGKGSTEVGPICDVEVVEKGDMPCFQFGRERKYEIWRQTFGKVRQLSNLSYVLQKQ